MNEIKKKQIEKFEINLKGMGQQEIEMLKKLLEIYESAYVSGYLDGRAGRRSKYYIKRILATELSFWGTDLLEIIFTENGINNLIALHSITYTFLKKNNIGGRLTSDEVVELLKQKDNDYLEYILDKFKDVGIVSDEQN